MCTVSVISLPDGVLRLACNRDELLTRAEALPPLRRHFGAQQAILPIDPTSGGTWIAVNTAGLIFTILNARRGWVPDHTPPRSRGEIIPSLLHCATIDDALEHLARLDAALYGPFHLLIVGRQGGAEVMSDGRRVMRRRWSLARLPIMLTSSGLGDELVTPPRRELFDRMITFGEQTAAAQDGFHRHSWPDREYLSVRMRRADARTVSVTTVEVSNHGQTMQYRAASAIEVPATSNRTNAPRDTYPVAHAFA